MEYPITVNKIEWDDDGSPINADRLFGAKAGAWVSVRLAGEDKKTYLGVMLGDYKPTALAFDKSTGTLHVTKSLGNPAMWVPDLKRVIMGYESWWGEIKSPEALRKITDADIESVWYVQALKTLSEAEPPASKET